MHAHPFSSAFARDRGRAFGRGFVCTAPVTEVSALSAALSPS